MRQFRISLGMPTVALLGITLFSLSCTAVDKQSGELPKDLVVQAISKVERNGQTYTSKKYQFADGKWGAIHLDEKGAKVDRVPVLSRNIIDPRLQARLKLQPGQPGYIGPGDPVEVIFVLPDEIEPYRGPEAVIEVELGTEGEQVININGNRATERDFEVLKGKWLDDADAAHKARLDRRQRAIGKLVEINGWTDQDAKKAVKRGAISLRRTVTGKELSTLAQRNKGLVVSIEPWIKEVDELTSAMAATNVQSWAIDRGHDGSGMGVYMREANGTNCPSNASMNTGLYTNMSSLGSSNHANHVGNILATVAPAAHVYCDDQNFMSSTGSQSPRPWVANHSWGADDSGAYTTGDRDFDTGIYDDGWAVFKSAGNTGGEITSPGKAFNIIAVGNYNDATTSMAASSAFTNPDTNAEKP